MSDLRMSKQFIEGFQWAMTKHFLQGVDTDKIMDMIDPCVIDYSDFDRGVKHAVVGCINPLKSQTHINQRDKEFLLFICDRLAQVHDEPRNIDYMRKLKELCE